MVWPTAPTWRLGSLMRFMCSRKKSTWNALKDDRGDTWFNLRNWCLQMFLVGRLPIYQQIVWFYNRVILSIYLRDGPPIYRSHRKSQFPGLGERCAPKAGLCPGLSGSQTQTSAGLWSQQTRHGDHVASQAEKFDVELLFQNMHIFLNNITSIHIIYQEELVSKLLCPLQVSMLSTWRSSRDRGSSKGLPFDISRLWDWSSVCLSTLVFNLSAAQEYKDKIKQMTEENSACRFIDYDCGLVSPSWMGEGNIMNI